RLDRRRREAVRAEGLRAGWLGVSRFHLSPPGEPEEPSVPKIKDGTADAPGTRGLLATPLRGRRPRYPAWQFLPDPTTRPKGALLPSGLLRPLKNRPGTVRDAP